MKHSRRLKSVLLSLTFLSAALFTLLLGSSANAIPEQEVRWEGFVGNIRTGATGAVGSGAGMVNAAGRPWVATGGRARVNLMKGELRFEITGLVLADGNSVGTPGTNVQVRGPWFATLTVARVLAIPSSSTHR